MAERLVHLGIIADGNRRWAKAHNLPTLEGHRQGVNRVEEIVEALADTEVKYVSFYLFSTENWQRSADEVGYLMKLAASTIDRFTKKAVDNNVRIAVLGSKEHVDSALWAKIENAEKVTADNTGLTMAVCFNYGGRSEIADAATKAMQAGEKEITPEIISKYIYHPEIPDVDLIVRTSGEERISGFQLWRSAYAEFMFLGKMFPDLTGADCVDMIEEFHRRQRRFGK